MRQKNECQKRLADEIMDHMETMAKLKKAEKYNKELIKKVKELSPQW